MNANGVPIADAAVRRVFLDYLGLSEDSAGVYRRPSGDIFVEAVREEPPPTRWGQFRIESPDPQFAGVWHFLRVWNPADLVWVIDFQR
jgi:hypothetical protein